ncbi:wall-associated receptor kinase 2-like [Impatiens glandulifera]|uniref:wall-associated receptor kinase 2-like n=1 Tax=Impatiens glandulifera TaxID=253017 RepID=UPI001FB19E64|nr:wall-associated receptor kinase 2-like [Impatiens glandulifera]
MAFSPSSLPNKLILIIFFMSLYDCELAAATTTTTTTGSFCNRTCGEIEIPYPFGTTEECYLANDTYRGQNFLVTCKDDGKLYWATKNVTNTTIQISQINVSAAHIKILLRYIGEDCYNEFGQSQSVRKQGQLTTGSFVVSTTQNKFTVLGCDTYGQMTNQQNNMTFFTACTSYCASLTDVQDGKCDGLGCCQVPIPQNTHSLNSNAFSYYNHSKVFGFNPCGYAFIADTSVYNFSTKHLNQMPSEEERPVVLEWAISNKTCDEAAKDSQTFACNGQNNACLDVQNGEGYRCKCLDGYEGNPYLFDGCKGTN